MVFHTTDREKQRRQELKAILDISDEPSVSFRKKLRGWTAEYYKPALASILILLVTITYVSYYNVFVQMRAKVRGSRAQVMGALQMRQNLVPALTVLMHHFIKHEENIFLKIREFAFLGNGQWATKNVAHCP